MYAMFGFLFVNLQLLTLIICLLSIVQTYMQINELNWAWWWRSFKLGASGALYMGAYSFYYMVFVLKMDLLSSEIVYLFYMMLSTVCFAVMCGTISVISSYCFVKNIYSKFRGE
jgi:hypothetical protein